MKLMRKTRLEGWYEYYKTPCIICGHTGACMVHEDGDAVVCIRVESEKRFSKDSALPSYLHFLKGNKQKIDNSEVEDYEESCQKLESPKLDTVYRAFLNTLELTDSHYNHLTSPSRKLTDQEVMIRQYRSFPDRPWEVANQLEEDLGIHDFSGVPGFFLKDEKYWTLSGAKGILLPFRNHYNQIVGFQYRIEDPPNVVEIKFNSDSHKRKLKARIKEQPNLVQVSYDGEIILEKNMDISKEWFSLYHEGNTIGWIRVKKGNRYFWLSSANKPKGTGSGSPAPVHVAVPSSQLKNWKSGTIHKAKTVWLSEGPLKCDIAVDCIEKLYDPLELEDIGTTFIATPGVNSWRLALPVLKEMGVEQVNICFDADAVSNADVKKHLLECCKELKLAGYRANLIQWNESDGKGIDDLLLSRKLPHIKKLF